MINEAAVEIDTDNDDDADLVLDDPTPESAERAQEQADIKAEELAETPPTAPLKVTNSGAEAASAAVNGANNPEPQVDVKALSLDEKYALILGQVEQTGPLFFAQVNPSTFALPDRDPLNLIWINMLTGWQIASTILSQFKANYVGEQALAKETANADSAGTKETSEREEHTTETEVSGETSKDFDVVSDANAT